MIDTDIDYLLEVCELCNLRPKSRRSETAKWCNRCYAMKARKESLSAGTAIAIMERNLGQKYIHAEMSHLEESTQIELKRPHRDIYMWGSIGSGKTYAMAALFKYKLERGFDCKRINFDSFCCKVRSTMNQKSTSTEQDFIDGLIDRDCLFIDDIGLRSKQETDFAFVTFYTILNKRQEMMLPTYITTNKSIKELAVAFDGRIASRLRTAIIIEMTGRDRRQERK